MAYLFDHRDGCSGLTHHASDQRKSGRGSRWGPHRRRREQLRNAAQRNLGGPLPRGPAQLSDRVRTENIDVRVSRQFRIRERYTLTFTGEAFNLFNFTNVVPTTGGGTSSAYNTTEYNLSGTT